MIYNPFDFMAPFLNPIPQCPPTLYSVMQSIVNGNKDESEEQTKIADLSKNARSTIFNFDYPLTNKVSKETFETTILNHYINRRIGFETVTLFRIKLNAKINEIIPVVNMMFDSFDGWDLFNTGETTLRTLENRTSNQSNTTMTNNSETTSESTSDNRFSELPQDEIEDIQNGSYMTDYRLVHDEASSTDSSSSTGASSGTSTSNDTERIERSVQNKVELMKEFQQNITTVYKYVYSQLDELFFGLV